MSSRLLPDELWNETEQRVLVDCSLMKAALGGPKQAGTRRIAAAREVSTVC